MQMDNQIALIENLSILQESSHTIHGTSIIENADTLKME